MKFAFIDLKKQYEVIGAEIEASLKQVLTQAQFINGPQVKQLEIELAQYVGTKQAVTCSDGTSSLEMALMALGVGPNDAVFCPSFTF
ncbi:MAG: DegT/DnrJ/EryC1/StrS family aminotransferase, partial [Candidatus Adiutrix sp.]